MMPQQPELPIVAMVQLGYLLFGLCVVAAIAVLAWDGRGFLNHPASARDRHHREYVGSLFRGVWQLASAVLVAISAGVSAVVLAWSLS